jgi:hypothetical protein
LGWDVEAAMKWEDANNSISLYAVVDGGLKMKPAAVLTKSMCLALVLFPGSLRTVMMPWLYSNLQPVVKSATML